MKTQPELVVMLTYNDFTVTQAAEIFEACRNTQATCWGFKEHPLPLPQMKSLYARMKDCGKTTFLEVVAYSEEEGLAGAEMAATCGCDVLMGTSFFPSINSFCQAHGLRYMPFVGNVSGRPSMLEGTLDGMLNEARSYLAEGAYGIDLLGYRFSGNAADLNREFTRQLQAPVCLAGSIDSFQRLDEVKDAAPQFFTIGSAFFDEKFGKGFDRQIEAVCNYMARP